MFVSVGNKDQMNNKDHQGNEFYEGKRIVQGKVVRTDTQSVELTGMSQRDASEFIAKLNSGDAQAKQRLQELLLGPPK